VSADDLIYALERQLTLKDVKDLAGLKKNTNRE
jgi:hypothetical protein